MFGRLGNAMLNQYSLFLLAVGVALVFVCCDRSDHLVEHPETTEATSLQPGQHSEIGLEDLDCTDDNLSACLELAFMFKNGEQMIADETEFLRLGQFACTRGLARACGAVVDHFDAFTYCGSVDDEDRDSLISEAISILEILCTDEDVLACTELAALCAYGRGVELDENRARSLYLTACDLGYGAACTFLARMYEIGTGLPVDLATAMVFYRLGCENNFEEACETVNMLEHRLTVGPGLTEEQLPADSIATAGATASRCDQGDLDACLQLARMYETGLGLPQDYSQAALVYEVMCEAGGLYHGCLQLTRLFRNGMGVEQDIRRADLLLHESLEILGEQCDSGLMESCLQLAWVYETGSTLDVEVNEATAADYRQQACEGGLESPICE